MKESKTIIIVLILLVLLSYLKGTMRAALQVRVIVCARDYFGPQ